MSCKYLPRSRRAFSLIEILIVLAIIGILAAILLPVFHSVRESGRRASCSSNLKQISFAQRMYSADYNQMLPPYWRPNFIPQCSWADYFYRYVKNEAIFNCPNQRDNGYIAGCPPFDTVDGVPNSLFKHDGSYSMNLMGVALPISEQRIRFPTQTIFFLDSDGDTLNPAQTPIASVEELQTRGVKPRHGEGINAAFGDGHVKWLSLQSLLARAQWRADGAS